MLTSLWREVMWRDQTTCQTQLMLFEKTLCNQLTVGCSLWGYRQEAEFGQETKETVKAVKGQREKLETFFSRTLIKKQIRKYWLLLLLNEWTAWMNVIILSNIKKVDIQYRNGPTDLNTHFRSLNIHKTGGTLTSFCNYDGLQYGYIHVLVLFLSGRSFPVAEPATESRSVPAPVKTGSPSHFPSIWPWMSHTVLLVYSGG